MKHTYLQNIGDVPFAEYIHGHRLTAIRQYYRPNFISILYFQQQINITLLHFDIIKDIFNSRFKV